MEVILVLSEALTGISVFVIALLLVIYLPRA